MTRISPSTPRPQPPATPTAGAVAPSPSTGPQVAPSSIFDRLSDTFDGLVGVDPPGPKPITLTGVKDADFSAMEAKVQELERGQPALTPAQRQQLESGRLLSSWSPRPDGLVEELTMGVVDVPLEQLLEKVPMAAWGPNLAGYKGGQVVPFGPDRQVERMVLRMPGKDLDMTKVEQLHERRDAQGTLQGTQVRWEVLKSDNGTTVADVGTLRFERFGDKTLVTFHSAHKLDKFSALTALLPKKVQDAATGEMLSLTFKQHLERYRQLAG